MKKNISLSATILFCLFCLFLAGCAATGGRPPEEKTPSAAVEIAKAYGIDRFQNIDAIRFTFHARVNDKNVKRTWSWDPQTDRVIYNGPGPDGEASVTVTYNRKQKASPDFNAKIDQWFINDQYWLLFPFHLVWDPDITLTAGGRQPLPIPPGTAQKLTVQYPPDVGYTPGDVYELYYNPKTFRVRQWIYRRGGAEDPTRIATWEDHSKAGPILFSLTHNGPEDDFRVWFTDVAVQRKGGNEWLNARPSGSG